MKNLFDAARYHTIASSLAKLAPRFDADRFLALTLDGLDQRELMARLRQTALAADAALPGTFRDKVDILRAYAPTLGYNFVGIWPCEFVARFGLDDPLFSLAALRELTEFGSAEFAIRPFILRDQPGTLTVIQRWATDENEHVRRLASEGSRPRLPWGTRLQSLIVDPSPTLPILETLRADPSLYVRKSVANHLNDIAKDHPDVVIDLVSGWDRSSAPTAWIVKHGLRTLIKQGHSPALELLGVGAIPKLDVTFNAAPKRIQLGDTVTFTATLKSTARHAQSLVVDYVLHYARASGASARKVFKWKQFVLEPGETLVLTKRQTIRDFSTRRHHAGRHRIELQINGRRLAETGFALSV